MPSFDIVSEVDKQEIKNAVEQTNKEVGNRFDFKGSDARVEQTDYQLTVFADDEFKLGQVKEILNMRLVKRGIDIRSLDTKNVETISGSKVKQQITVKVGIETELAKKIIKLLKDSKMKAQGSIQGDVVRVSGAKRDTLQEAIQLIKSAELGLPLQFNNFRD
ncbi:YajQ family cyclic di-GMP-binding protein [Ferrovum sp. PN-J185]|uniref:YajQ family cyclic di-GMP-binding protein n=1 Tax=Ferrovum sp. PN-J185 TaxID=1356306 RepID=UPI000791B2A1|nr:YajQ family cyclic di-GMP-binding protein [Ferrovum sp. PN-J185]KXW55677.1 putative nucleotide-binding protein [Ferrovum sp. PN-J185]MCC6068820.1 YajQ family cyclic di-GMP-binding protein [Ferrovum sp. PN-J185]MDE2056979.1 YajQ family cyclic di-GMP-binding protein [Betaproteobacteria bacterium]